MLPHARGMLNLSGKCDSGHVRDVVYCHKAEVQKGLGSFCSATWQAPNVSAPTDGSFRFPAAAQPRVSSSLSTPSSTSTDIAN